MCWSGNSGSEECAQESDMAETKSVRQLLVPCRLELRFGLVTENTILGRHKELRSQAARLMLEFANCKSGTLEEGDAIIVFSRDNASRLIETIQILARTTRSI